MKSILRGEALAIVAWIDLDIAAKAAAVASEVAVEDYRVAPGFQFQADAAPLFEARTERDVENYLRNGQLHESRFAARMYPSPTPATLIEKAVAAAWPGGAERLRLRGKRAPFGLVRHLAQGAQVWPHTDNSDLDRPEVLAFARATTNLSALAYLAPGQGGELSIWRKRLTTREEISALRLAGHPYALDPQCLSEPGTVIHPKPGMVVIFDAKNIHAVGLNRGTTTRVTQSGFILVGNFNSSCKTYY
ncbi:MAG: hypothetical protein OMOMHJEC_01333 [Xanthomonadales bacterium]|nr:hypothetical protein [Xanthomonadales bacterium]